MSIISTPFTVSFLEIINDPTNRVIRGLVTCLFMPAACSNIYE